MQLMDYADMDEIKHSQQAFQSVRQQLGKTYLPLINGEYQATQERLIPSTLRSER